MGARDLQEPALPRGAGGKSGGGGGGEAPNTVRSTQIADVVDLISEGEIEGLTNGLKSIYLDGVPLENPDGSKNFDGVQVSIVTGTQGQSSITGADGVQNEVGVAAVVLAASPIVRTISNPAIDTCRVTIAIDQLSKTDTKTGKVEGSSFEWAIEVQSDGGGFVEVLRETIDEKTMSRYTRSKRFALPGGPGGAPWDVRVKRLSADATGAYEVNAFSWASYTEIQSLKLRLPNSALVRTRVNARPFSRIPVRSFDTMGMRVQVPSNYDTRAKTYSGVWDGSFVTAWTDCPVWVYNAILTHQRYGLGRYFTVGSSVKWDLYSIGRYCDGMVPDGKGGMEPRFRCGVVLSTREQAYKVLADLAAVFRGMSYWAGLDVAVTQDAPCDPSALFTPANVVGGKFTYLGGASRAALKTQWTVWWNDLSQNGKLVPETVVDRDLERRLGVRPMELSPLGTWSRGQARRLAQWARYSQQYEDDTVSFRVGLDGVLVPPGRTFQIADPHEAGERFGGRVHAATTTQVTLDAPVTLAAGESYLLTVMLQDPGDPARLVTQQRALATAAGTTNVLGVAAAYSSAPAPQSVWLLQSDQVQATTWRCIGLTDVNDTNEFEILGVRHYPQKYDYIEQGIAFEPPSVSRIKTVPPAPLDLSIVETVYAIGGEQRSRATISWRTPAEGLQYLTSWRLAGGPWTDVPSTSSNTVDVDGLPPGLLDVTVRSRNAIGNSSPAVSGSLLLTANATAAMRIQASGLMFAFDAAGSPKPTAQSLTFRALPVSLAGTITFTATAYSAAGTSLGAVTLSGADDTRSLSVSDFGSAAYVVVQASIGSYSDQVQVVRLADGTAGSSGTSGLNVAKVFIYQRSASGPPALPSSTTTFYFSGGVLSGLDNGWSGQVPSGRDPLYVSAATASASAATDTIDAGEWASAVVLAQDGSAGINSATVYLFQRTSSPTPPSLPSATVTYTFGDGVASGVNNGWAQSMPTSGGSYRWMTTAAALGISTSDTIAPGEWANTSLMAQDGTPGAEGQGAFTMNVSPGMSYSGGVLTKTTASTGWDEQAFSSESFRDAAFCSAQAISTSAGSFMFGLNDDPSADASYTSIDFAWFIRGDGYADIYESGSGISNGAYAAGDVFSIVADGDAIRYYKNGIHQRTSSTSAAGRRFFFDSSSTGGSIKNIRFGPGGIAGANGVNGLNVAKVFIYQRSASGPPALPSSTTTFYFSGGVLSGLDNGWSATIPGGSDPLYVSAATASSAATTDTIAGGEWAGAVVFVQDGAAGAAGINSATVYLFQRTSSPTPPSLPSASVTYTFGTGLASGVNNGWTQTLPTSGGPYRWATTAAALGTGTSDTLAPGEWAAASVLASDGSDGPPGPYLATVYVQSTTTPSSSPTGGSFNFATGVLTPPSLTSATQPGNSTSANTYAFTFYFTSSTPGATVTGGTWSAPIPIYQAPALQAGIVSPGPSINVAVTGNGTATVTGGIKHRTTGAIARKPGSSGAYADVSFWYRGGAPGSTYYIRYYVLQAPSGGATLSGIAGGGGAFSSDHTVTGSAGIGVAGEARVGYDIAPDEGFGDIVQSGVLAFIFENTP